MVRQLRIEFKGALYHVLSRGNQGQDIFLDDKDRIDFIDVLAEISERFEIDVFAFVLMNNHYHLLLRTKNPNLSKAMQWLGTTYTRRFNLRHFINGHLFQGRFKSILVENDSYLARASYYIHRNPIRAGIVKRLSDYKWSSYNAYAYIKRHYDWLKTDLILSQSAAKDKHRAYREKVQRYSDEKNRIWEDVRHEIIYGTQNFVDQIKSRYLSNQPDPELPQINKLLKDEDPVRIVQRAAKIIGCDPSKYKQSSRISESKKEKRDMLIFLLWETGRYTNSEIGSLFGLSYSSVSRRVAFIRPIVKQQGKYGKIYRRLKALIKV